jgi:hypothetical protein
MRQYRTTITKQQNIEHDNVAEKDHYHFYFWHPLKSLLKKMFQISQTLI